MFLAGLLEDVGLTGGLLAALVLIASLFMGERRKRKAAEVRANAAREGARAANAAKDALLGVSTKKDEAIKAAEAEGAVKMRRIDEDADAVDRAAVESRSALADAWNNIMSRKK